MTVRDLWRLGRVLPSVLAVGGALSWLSVSGGDGARSVKRTSSPEPSADDQPPADDDGLPPIVERAFERLGLGAGAMRERAEGMLGIYRLLKALGLNDADIARLVVQKGGERLDSSVDIHRSDVRPVFDALEDSVLRAAEEMDARLNLHGDLIRRIREGAATARAGREDVLASLSRNLTQGREGMRRLLRAVGGGEA